MLNGGITFGDSVTIDFEEECFGHDVKLWRRQQIQVQRNKDDIQSIVVHGLRCPCDDSVVDPEVITVGGNDRACVGVG